jgi:hypothetical protein
MITSENCDPTVPKMDILMESSNLRLDFDRLQYTMLLETLQLMRRLDTHLNHALRRPAKRPTEDPRAWWKYAYSLVSGTEYSATSMFEKMTLCMRSKQRYMQLVQHAYYRKHGIPITDLNSNTINLSSSSKDEKEGETVKKGAAKGKGTKKTEAVSKADMEVIVAAEVAELETLENILPMSALMVFRQIAAVQLRKEDIQRKKEGKGASGAAAAKGAADAGGVEGKRTWGQWWSGKDKNGEDGKNKYGLTKAEEEEDEALIQEIREKLAIAPAAAKGVAVKEEFNRRINLLSSLTLRLTTDAKPVARLQLQFLMGLEFHTGCLSMNFTLQDLVIYDEYTKKPVSPYLIIGRPQKPLKRERIMTMMDEVMHDTARSFNGTDPGRDAQAKSPSSKLVVSIETRPGKLEVRPTMMFVHMLNFTLCII